MSHADIDDPDYGTAPKPDKGKGGRDLIECVVVTPETTLLDARVEFIALPLFDGELGILPGRAPLIGRLGFGELRTVAQGQTRRYFVDGGFAQVRDDVVTVLTNRAIASDKVQVAAVSEELTRAQERKASTEAEQVEKTRAIDRARAQLRVASHKG